jgi:hypothetical protein
VDIKEYNECKTRKDAQHKTNHSIIGTPLLQNAVYICAATNSAKRVCQTTCACSELTTLLILRLCGVIFCVDAFLLLCVSSLATTTDTCAVSQRV